MARQQIGRPQKEAHLRGLHIVGVLDNLSEALEPIAREQSSATPGCVERLSYRTCKPLKPLPQALDCRSGFLSVGWLVGGARRARLRIEDLVGSVNSARNTLAVTVRVLLHRAPPGLGTKDSRPGSLRN